MQKSTNCCWSEGGAPPCCMSTGGRPRGLAPLVLWPWLLAEMVGVAVFSAPREGVVAVLPASSTLGGWWPHNHLKLDLH